MKSSLQRLLPPERLHVTRTSYKKTAIPPSIPPHPINHPVKATMVISATPDPTTLPDEPLFRRMMANAIKRPSHVLISDRTVGAEADSVKVFADLLHMRNVIRQRDATPDSYISVLMPVNYEFIITALAVLASGQAFAPIRTTTFSWRRLGARSCILIKPLWRRLRVPS